MRRTYRKNILRTVRASLSRFLAIFAIVALGVGFLSGLLASPVDMRLSADDYCRALNLYDIKIQATQGLTEGDLNAVRSTEGVGAVMPAYDMDLMLKSQTGKTLTTRLMSIPGDGVEEEDKLNDLVLVDGRMPSAPDEIVVGLTKDFSGDRPQVGDILTVSADNEESISDALPDSFTVVGTVRSAAYFSVETEYTNVGTGTIALFAYANDSAFEMDYYTTFYIAVDGARELNSFSSAYEEKVGQVYARLDAIKDERAKLRYDEIVGEAQAQLDDARAEYEKGKAEAEAELADAAQELETGRAKLADARRQYTDGMVELENGRRELADGEQAYEEGKAEAQAELDDAWEQILDAESDVREIEQGKWILGDRDDNVSFSSYDSNAQRIANIATVFPVFFFLVAALVALTTMTRMVEEERLQIGTMKALGYSRGKIAAKYLLYALAASLAGSAVGMVIGMQLFPSIILNAYNIMYDLPVLKTPFNTLFGAIATGTAVACTLLATLNACWAELREQPASLMLPKAPKAGKRILLEHIRPVWRRMRFTHKVTARNLFLYKKRFFMTVVGIAGCTALLVTGFGVRDSISNIVEKQFDDLAHYQLMVSIQDESATQGKELQALLNDTSRITGYLPVAQQDVTVVPEGDAAADNLYITVPTDTAAMNDYFTFRHRNGGGSIELGEGSVIITEKLAERQGLKAGDIITVEDADGNTASFTITDVCENYISHYLYMSAGVYEAAFGKAPETNLLLCQLADGMDEDPQAEEALATELLQCRDVAGAQFTHELTASFSQSLGSINYIVVVLIIAAGALAFVVLYNLTNINISERAKELATIKVLGFYDSEVGAYIYRETSLLTLIGTACGLAFGVALHTFVIRTAEVDMVMFGRSIYPLSFVWSALLTILFSLLVNAVMYRKLKAISMVESMKAPE